MHGRNKSLLVGAGVLVGVLLSSLLLPGPVAAQGEGSTAEAAGIVFQTLSDEDLDAIQAATGYRVGVLVAEVEPGSAGSRAGIKPGDVILAIGQTGADNAEAAAQAVRAASGTVTVMAITQTAAGYETATYSLDLSGDTSGSSGQPAASGPASVGWQLESLPIEALDKIEKETGYRFGVVVVQVTPESPAAQAGIRANDIILVVGRTAVDSAEAVDQALAGQSGALTILALRPGEKQFETVQCTINLTSGSTATAAAGSDIASAVTAYLDMQDFIRTEAWGRAVSTPPAERQRVAALLQGDWGKLDPQAQSAVGKITETWAALQKAWKSATEEKRNEQRDLWRKQLLLPTQLFIAPAEHQTFRTEGDTVVFNYPSDWIGAQAEDKGVQYLYLGPPDTKTTWQEVLNPQASPPGALFALAPMDEGLRAVKSQVEAARLLARQFVTPGAPDFKEIDALDLGQGGAIITLVGRYPDQKEEKFFWVGVTGFGSDHFIVGRCGGPTAQAETLVPALGNMLVSLQLHPPAAGGGGAGYQPGEAAMAFDVASGKVTNAILAEGWAGTHN